MNAFFYYFFLSLIKLLSLIPIRLLYLLTSPIYFVLYYILGHRKDVVRENLKMAFPNKTKFERLIIEKQSFKQLCNILIEIIAMNGLSRKKVLGRIKLFNTELLNEIYSKNQEVICVAAHQANWELATLIAPFIKHTILGVYKPLSNQFFNRIMIRNRSLFGALPVPINDLIRKTIEYKKNKIPTFIYLIADQRPAPQSMNNWLSFFNRQVPVIDGPEKIARKLNCPVVYMHIKMPKRGCYEIYFSLICNTPAELPENRITEIYFKKLEENIIENPALYMWIHNRWKITR